MKVFCYFQPIEKLGGRAPTLDMWRASWGKRGFDPVVLNEQFAATSPLYSEFSTAIRSWPSVNPAGFDYHALMRWLAVAHAGGGLSTEPDVINYSLAPEHLPMEQLQETTLHLHCHSPVPAMLFGNAMSYEACVRAMIAHKVTSADHFHGRPHLSDQDFTARYLENRLITFHRASMLSRDVFEPGWSTAACVHYGTPYMAGHSMLPKHDWIPRLRQGTW